MVWSTTKVHGCNASSFADAVFDADTGTILKKANPVLSAQILGLSDTKKPGFQPNGLTGDDPSLYEGLSYDFAEYVVRIRDLVCKGVPANVCPPSDCTITLKFFPQFVNANTAGQLVKERPPTKCVKDRNDKTMVAWVHALKTMAENKKVAMMAIMRNESDRQFSTFHQFAPAGTQFDCSLRREPTTFSVMSRKYTDGLINIEDCWTGPGGAGKCLRDALELVGLSADPMGDMGTRVMAGSSLDWAAHGNAAAPATAPVLAPVPAASIAGPAQLEFNAMAPALAGAAVAAPLPAFMASSEGFKGFRKGYHFGLGAEGLGYYINSAPVTHMAAPLGFPMRHEPLGYPTRHEPQPLPLQRAHQVVSFTQVGQLAMEQMLPMLPASLPLPPTTTREAWAAWAATPVSLRALPAEHPDKYEYAKARSSCATDAGAMFLSKGNGVVEKKADPAPPPTSPAPLPLLSPSASLPPGKAGAKKASAAEKAAAEKAAVEKAAAEKAAAEKAAAEKAAAEKAAVEKAAAEKAAAEKAAAEKAAVEKAAAARAEAKRKKLEQLEEYKTAIGGTFTSPSLQAPAAATEKPTPAEKPTEVPAEEKVQEKPEGSEELAKESAAEEELAAAEEEPAAKEEEPAAKEEPAKAAQAKESKEKMDAEMAALKAAKDAGDITVVEYAEAIAKLKEKTAAAEKAAVEQAAAKKAADEKAAAQKAEEKAKAEEEKAKAKAKAEAEAEEKEEKETAEREIRIAAEKAEAEKAAAEKAAVSSEEPVKEPAEPEEEEPAAKEEEPAAKEEPAKAAQAKESKEKMDAEMAALKAAKDAGDITVVEYAEAIAKLRQEQQVAEQAAAAAASAGQDPPDRKRKPAEADGKYSSQGEEEREEPLGEPAALQPAVITSQVQLERRIDDLEHEIAAALRVDELEHNSEEAQLLMAGRAEVAKKEALFASQLPWSKNARKRKARRKALR
jgi:hypothetical protein